MRTYVVPKDARALNSMRCVEREQPTAGRGQVLVRMRAASVNARDVSIITGAYFLGPLAQDTVPMSDGAGEVSAVGEDVTRFAVGDRVVTSFLQTTPPGPLGSPLDGCLTEYALFAEDGVLPMPAHLSFHEGACLPCAGVTAWNALMHGPRSVKPGDTVLTLGTGGVSVFAIQIARMAGARVIVTSSSDEKIARALKLGAHHGINYVREPEWEKAVLELTGQQGVDHVVETGGLGTLPRSYRAVGRDGIVNVVGMMTRPEGDLSPYPLMRKNALVRALVVGTREHFAALLKAIEANALRPVIDQTFPFEQAIEACAYQASGRHFGKVVISI
ncbi:hypothetical protein WL74_29390 [Burkholderia cepacia]|uniref:zinc-dependent alcohol dehydrogenase family protein n=1 Tax=Burkholderia cepacia TaxID=292 RepID=UPI00075F8667|nr:NAD(P)-dependent alcohol dehydrogenase [Burkholderia cepacia]KWE18349.1 hypothetical protein WL74_29390 [Burkholderia cepacia]